jgi:hypothetical protein
MVRFRLFSAKAFYVKMQVSEASYNSQGAKISLQVDEAHLKGTMSYGSSCLVAASK